MVLIILTITCILAYNKQQKEIEERQVIQQMITQAELTEAEHQVDIVQSPEMLGHINDKLEKINFDNKQTTGYMPIEFQVEGMFNDKYTMEDYFYLCGNTYYETGSQNNDCQRACVSVPINRANDTSYYPNTIKEVIEQKGQYQGAISGEIYKYIAMYKGEIEVSEEEFEEMERVAENVAYVLEEGVTGTWEYQAQFEQGVNCIWIDGDCYGDRRKEMII